MLCYILPCYAKLATVCHVLFHYATFCSLTFIFNAFAMYVTLRLVMQCSVLFCSVLFCSVLFCSVLFCSVLFCSVLFCSVLPYTFILCYVLVDSAWLFSALFSSVLPCCITLFCLIEQLLQFQCFHTINLGQGQLADELSPEYAGGRKLQNDHRLLSGSKHEEEKTETKIEKDAKDKTVPKNDERSEDCEDEKRQEGIDLFTEGSLSEDEKESGKTVDECEDETEDATADKSSFEKKEEKAELETKTSPRRAIMVNNSVGNRSSPGSRIQISSKGRI